MLSDDAQNRIIYDGQDLLSYSQDVDIRLTEYLKDVKSVVEENHMYIRIASNDFFAVSKDCLLYTSSLLAGAAMIIWGDWMVGIFVDAGEAEVISYAYKYIRCLAWFYYLLAILGILRSGVQGLGHSGSAMFAGLTEMIARTVMGLFVIPVYGFTAACFTDQAALIAATVYITVDFFIIMKKERKKREDVITEA